MLIYIKGPPKAPNRHPQPSYPLAEVMLRFTQEGSLVCACVFSYLSCVCLFGTLWTVACQAPLSVGFSRKEYWSGLPFLPPGNHLNPRTKPRSPALLADYLPLNHQESPGSLVLINK